MQRLASLLCVTVLFGAAVAQDPTKDNYYPLKKGARWTYKSGADTVIVEVTGTEKVKFLSKDKDQKVVESEESAFVVETSIAGEKKATEHIVARPEGLYRVKVSNVDVKPPVQFLKLPPKKGDSWEVNSQVGSESLKGKLTVGEDKKSFLDKKDQAVFTVTGDEMTANGIKMKLKYYFAADVGIVLQEASLGGVTIKLELTKYEAGKEAP